MTEAGLRMRPTRKVRREPDVGKIIDRLLNNPARLAHLFHAHQVTIVRVAIFAPRHFEIHVRVGGVRPRFANVPGHATTAQSGTRQADRNRVFAWFIRSLWIGKVPELLSASPWISRIGVLIFCAFANGESFM